MIGQISICRSIALNSSVGPCGWPAQAALYRSRRTHAAAARYNMAMKSNPPETAAVLRHYDSDPEHEWTRMDRHRMEFATTLRALREWLPPPPARVLDCGGGPGRYAIELVRLGYRVTLFDLSEGNLALARMKLAEAGVSVEAIEHGTALDLSRFADGAFDAVLLMGPLYHLLEYGDRLRAVQESARVLRPGGPLFAAFVTRFGAHRFAAAKMPAAPLRELGFDAIERIGHEGPDKQGFVGYYVHPDELTPLLADAGLRADAILALEGILARLEELGVNALQGDAWQYWCDYTWRIARDPNIRGAADHLLAIARHASSLGLRALP
jgi:ubiquinone/menaquinone biosynthesis C-methylase UbiE